MKPTDLNRKHEQIMKFAEWTMDRIGIQNRPDIELTDDIAIVKKHRAYGATTPDGKIWTYVGNRTPADAMRTLCHEILHAKQFEDGVAHEQMDEKTEQHIEDLANAHAGRMMRKYGKQHEEIYEYKVLNKPYKVKYNNIPIKPPTKDDLAGKFDYSALNKLGDADKKQVFTAIKYALNSLPETPKVTKPHDVRAFKQLLEKIKSSSSLKTAISTILLSGTYGLLVGVMSRHNVPPAYQTAVVEFILSNLSALIWHKIYDNKSWTETAKAATTGWAIGLPIAAATTHYFNESQLDEYNRIISPEALGSLYYRKNLHNYKPGQNGQLVKHVIRSKDADSEIAKIAERYGVDPSELHFVPITLEKAKELIAQHKQTLGINEDDGSLICEYVDDAVMKPGFTAQESHYDGKMVLTAKTITAADEDWPKTKGWAKDKPLLKVELIIKGEKLGIAYFKQIDDYLVSDYVEIDPSARGNDLAQYMYLFVRDLGANIRPSVVQTIDGMKMWNKWKKNGVAQALVAEGKEGSLIHDVADSLPYAYSIPDLDSSNNPYLQYKFSVAIAGARGKKSRDSDGLQPFHDKSEAEYFNDEEVVISFDPNIGEIIDQAMADIGMKGGKRIIGVKGSKESPDVDKRSPVQGFRGFS